MISSSVSNSDDGTARQIVRAAHYVRMSTEHQKYSTENQADIILLVDQLPLARSLKRRGTPAEGIQHVTAVIGNQNSTPLTVIRYLNHLSKEGPKYRIVVAPLLADGKSNSHSEAAPTIPM